MDNQNTAKTAQKLPGLVPTLRFPEFKDSGEWEVLELNNIADFISEKVPLKSISLVDYVSTENILSDYEGIEIASKLPATGSVTQYAKNDILISNIRPYLKKVWFANKAGGSSNDVIVVRAKEIILASYLSFILKNDAFIDYVMQGAKGVKMPRGDIELIKKYNIVYPKQQEQQKIAECLASLDELISAHSQKLEALKTHKKGLMQNLFPAEGETVPALRFPEFQNAEDWAIKPMKKLFKIGNGKDHKLLVSGNIPVYGSGGYMRSVDEYLYDGESACIGRKGTIDKPIFLSGKFWTVDTLFYTHSFENCLPKFIYLIF
ncbi:MAG: restriction endonuclease subunit S, partial [Methyloprofundus sp.]|nr:restriction endonuclease subunit S [Methyloprofundus sp.]